MLNLQKSLQLFFMFCLVSFVIVYFYGNPKYRDYGQIPLIWALCIGLSQLMYSGIDVSRNRKLSIFRYHFPVSLFAIFFSAAFSLMHSWGFLTNEVIVWVASASLPIILLFYFWYLLFFKAKNKR